MPQTSFCDIQKVTVKSAAAALAKRAAAVSRSRTVKLAFNVADAAGAASKWWHGAAPTLRNGLIGAGAGGLAGLGLGMIHDEEGDRHPMSSAITGALAGGAIGAGGTALMDRWKALQQPAGKVTGNFTPDEHDRVKDLQDKRTNISQRTYEAAKTVPDEMVNAYDHPGQAAGNAAHYGLWYAPKAINSAWDALRRRSVDSAHMGNIVDPKVLRAAAGQAAQGENPQFGLKPEVAQTMYGSSDAALEGMGRHMKPGTSRVSGLGNLNEHNYPSFVGSGMKELAHEGVTPRGSAWKPFGQQSDVLFEEPHPFSPGKGFGAGKWGHRASWAIPAVGMASQYVLNHSGLTPEETAEYQQRMSKSNIGEILDTIRRESAAAPAAATAAQGH